MMVVPIWLLEELAPQVSASAEGQQAGDGDSPCIVFKLPSPTTAVDLESLHENIQASIGFLQVIGGACGLHACEVQDRLPDEWPETIGELVNRCDVEELLAAFRAALMAVRLVVQQSVGSEELFGRGISEIKEVLAKLEKLETYSPESEVMPQNFVLKLTAARVDLHEFEVRLSEACREILLDMMIHCGQKYGHTLTATAADCLVAKTEDEQIEAQFPEMDVAGALEKARAEFDPVAHEEASTYARGF